MCFKTFLPRPEMTCRFPIPPLRAAWLLAATTLLTACAVQPDRQGRLQFQVDNAELFGQTVDAFRMPDGSEARLRVLNGQYSSDYNLIAAASMMIALPTLIVYLALQKQFISGLTLGANKG